MMFFTISLSIVSAAFVKTEERKWPNLADASVHPLFIAGRVCAASLRRCSMRHRGIAAQGSALRSDRYATRCGAPLHADAPAPQKACIKATRHSRRRQQ
jgi:hypothetical protein